MIAINKIELIEKSANSSYNPEFLDEVLEYVLSASDKNNKTIAKPVRLLACRFLKELKRHDLILNFEIADWAIRECQTIRHVKGPLKGKTLELLPYQKFLVYFIYLFYWKSTGKRKITTIVVYMARKNGKSLFAAALIWTQSVLYRHEGSNALMVSASLKQIKDAVMKPLESHVLSKYLDFNDPLKKAKQDGWRVSIHNNNDCNISHSNIDGGGGSVSFSAFATNPKAHDSFGGNCVYLDECHEMPHEEFEVCSEATIAYPESLTIVTSTAGSDASHFFNSYIKDLKGDLEAAENSDKPIDETTIAFICEPEVDDNGNVNYFDENEVKKANPSMGTSFLYSDFENKARDASRNSFKLMNFLRKRMNVYVNDTRSYFDVELFKKSDNQFNWDLTMLAKSGISWVGVVDLSKVNDLTCAGLYGVLPSVEFDDGKIKDVDIFIPHCFFPRSEAYRKSEEDKIPVFQWEDEGALTICEGNTVDYNLVEKWFLMMRQAGFKISSIYYDPKFSGEFIPGMKSKGFKATPQQQYGYLLTPGFNRIHKKAYDGEFYYLHSPVFSYCVANVAAREMSNQSLTITKIKENKRIDAFMGAVFGACGVLDEYKKLGDSQLLNDWFS